MPEITRQIDPQVAINRYFILLEYVVHWLPRFVDRDLQAEALVKADKRHDVYHGRRVWTRRDERYLKVRTLDGGWVPNRRTDRLTEQIVRLQRELQEKVFQEELDRINEIRPLMLRIKSAFFEAIDIARQIPVGLRGRKELSPAIQRIESLRIELFDHLNPVCKPERRGKQQKTYTVDARVAMLCKATPEAMYWTAQEIADVLDANVSSVKKSETWKKMMLHRRETRESRKR